MIEPWKLITESVLMLQPWGSIQNPQEMDFLALKYVAFVTAIIIIIITYYQLHYSQIL